MHINFGNLSVVLVIVAAATGFDGTAIAQPASSSQAKVNETLSETFDRAFFKNDPDFFRNRSFKRQFEWMFGPSGFVENEITRDGKLVHNLYQTSLDKQVASDPIIRTRDLPNPYETSILSSPAINVNPGVRDDELIFEKR